MNEAVAFYNERVAGLGDEFLETVQRAAQVIAENPETWPAVAGDVRRYVLRRFPYGLFYSIESDFVLILAVMHLRRRPNY